MTKSDIIIKAQLYLDDLSELSTAEFSDLFDKIYNRVCAFKAWEFTKKSHAGTTTGAEYIALPSDFASLALNHNHTDSSTEADRPVVFVGSTYAPYKVVSWSDRRQYRGQSNVCWVDIVNERLYFGSAPTSGEAVEFDYLSVMPDLADGDEPAFPARFHDILYHGMVADELMIEQSDKATSYAPENTREYNRYLDDMAVWNARLVQL